MRRLVTLALAFALVGCGSSGSTFTSSAQVAAAGGCGDYKADTGQIELFVTDSGTCTLSGQSLKVLYFKTTDLAANWMKIASQFAGAHYLHGDQWVLSGSGADTAALKTAQAKLGGTLS